MKLSSRAQVVLPLVVAAAVSAPALGMGFILDDWLQRAVVNDAVAFTEKSALFSFGPGSPEALAPWIRSGPFPWFTWPSLKLRFLRPLSSALIVFDTTVFGSNGWPQHLHSTLWYVALCAVVAALYRRFVPGLAFMAALVFAIDDAHVMPTAWLANRNALVASLFVWLGLWAHLAWRERGVRSGAWLSMLAYAVGLTAGETAVAALAYVLTYEVLGRKESFKSRLVALMPAGAVMLVYGCIYKWTQAGARASATYIDPVTEPLRFLGAAPERFLANIGSASLGLPDLWLLFPDVRWILVVGGVFGGAFAVWAYRRSAPTDEAERRTLRWLWAGALLSLLPTLATFPAARLLTAASLGLSPLVAVVVKGALADRGLRRAVVLVWAAVAFAIAPLAQWLSMPLTFRAASQMASAGLDKLDLRGGERVIIAASTDFILAIYGVPLLADQHRPLPLTWHAWSMAAASSTLLRTSERRFELEVDGHMVNTVFEENFRSAAYPFTVGEKVQLDGMTVSVLAIDDGRPTRIAAELDLPPEAFVFVWWNGDALERFEVPAVGERKRFPRTLPLLERLVPGRGDRLE